MSKPNQGYAFRYETSLRKVDAILAALEQPKTRGELADAVGLSVRAVQSYLAMLLDKKNQRIRIQDWRPNSPGSPSAVYIAGAGRNKRKPRAMTAGERSKKRYQCAEFAIQQMHINRMKRMKLARDPLTAALFGAA